MALPRAALSPALTRHGATSDGFREADDELLAPDEASDDDSEAESEGFSDEESESDGLQSDDGREHVEGMGMNSSASAGSSSAAVLEQRKMLEVCSFLYHFANVAVR